MAVAVAEDSAGTRLELEMALGLGLRAEACGGWDWGLETGLGRWGRGVLKA